MWLLIFRFYVFVLALRLLFIIFLRILHLWLTICTINLVNKRWENAFVGGRSREAERISNAFLLSSSLSFGQSPRRGKSLLWLFSAFPLLLPASSFSYRYGLSVKGPKKLLSYFLEKKNYILLYLEEAFSNHQRITRLRRDTTTCLLPTTKKRHLFLFPFFCHLISTSKITM